MNRITFVALIFLLLHFIIKPTARTFPTLKATEPEDSSWVFLYETIGDCQGPNTYELLDGLIHHVDDWEEQDQVYI